MRSVAEWDKFFQERYNRKTNPEYAAMSEFDFFKDMCTLIQLDAMRAGMERAAIVLQKEVSTCHGPHDDDSCMSCNVRNNSIIDINNAAARLTEKDLPASQ